VLDLLEDALATHRLTKLVLDDELTRPVREAVWRRFPPESTRLGYVLTCPWCSSIWVAAGVVAARRASPSLWRPLARVLAASTATGLAFERL